jgi:putative endopeptidase
MKLFKSLVYALFICLTPFLSFSAPAGPPATEAPPSQKVAARALDPAEIDRSIDPCQDFFRYTCGTWLKSNPIPAEYPLWGRFNELQDKNLEVLHVVLEKAAAKPGTDPAQRAIGDYYAACMDESRAEKEGLSPLQPFLDRVAAVKNPADAIVESGRLHREGVPALFSFEATQDARDATEIIAEVDQGGLGLPDRDYYTKNDDKSKTLKSQYVDHLAKLFTLAGHAEATAAAEATRVLAFET